jgi:pimeloyl-ACP methyl ester carboxylesterase
MFGERMSTALMPFEVSGPEKGIPIVLVPGGLSGWISWKPHAEVLSKDFRVVRVQLLNMASAEKQQSPGAGYSLRKESEALKNTLDKLGLRKVNLVGWSHGGEVSLDFALNNPDRIVTLTLIEPAAYWVARAYGKFEEEEREFRNLFKEFHDPPTEEDVIYFLRMNGLVPPGVDPRSMPRWPVWNSLKTALLSLHTVVEHTDDEARLQLLRGKPVLLVKGKDSVGGNAGIVDLLSKALGPNSKVITLPDGHASHIVAQDQFIAELKQFIAAAK